MFIYLYSIIKSYYNFQFVIKIYGKIMLLPVKEKQDVQFYACI